MVIIRTIGLEKLDPLIHFFKILNRNTDWATELSEIVGVVTILNEYVTEPQFEELYDELLSVSELELLVYLLDDLLKFFDLDGTDHHFTFSIEFNLLLFRRNNNVNHKKEKGKLQSLSRTYIR